MTENSNKKKQDFLTVRLKQDTVSKIKALTELKGHKYLYKLVDEAINEYSKSLSDDEKNVFDTLMSIKKK